MNLLKDTVWREKIFLDLFLPCCPTWPCRHGGRWIIKGDSKDANLPNLRRSQYNSSGQRLPQVLLSNQVLSKNLYFFLQATPLSMLSSLVWVLYVVNTPESIAKILSFRPPPRILANTLLDVGAGFFCRIDVRSVMCLLLRSVYTCEVVWIPFSHCISSLRPLLGGSR